MADDRASSSDSSCIWRVRSTTSACDGLARRHQLGVPLLLLRNRRLVVLDRADALVGGLDLRAQHVDLGDERHQTRLQRPHLHQLVLGVDHLLAEAVACRLQRLELRAPGELIFQLAIDVGADGVEAVQPRFERFDERHAGGDARELRIELGHRFVQTRGLLRAFLDQRHLAEDGVHLGLELRRTRGQRAHAFVEDFERGAVRAELVAQLGDFGVRLVEVENLLAQQFEILPALLERIHVLDGLLRELVHLAQLLVQRVERELLLRELVALHEERLEALREAIDLLGQHDEVLVLGGQRLHPRLRVATPSPGARARARRTPRTPSF